ncbi:PhoX family phosphatase [Caulobacter sp. X]|uniref:PhoX family protein n=1 Tax=Caulobacter sp. X TaxID=2048901 RepID=UPI000C14BA12|nr:PhoX family phosphatase [Caulobacter sp. X]PIC00552.1 phosphatase [Caulobacter sp. X]
MTWPSRVHNDKGRAAPARPRGAAPISTLIDRRGLLAAGLAASLAPPAARAAAPPIGFKPLSPLIGPVEALPEGFKRTIVLRWGDPLWSDAPAFAPGALTAAAQARQFGYNNDFTAILPLPSGDPSGGLLVVNHEYPTPYLMFPGVSATDGTTTLDDEQLRVCMAACGMSVAEVRRTNGTWGVVVDSPYNRRITATTPIRISGPAAGHPKLRTGADPTGRWVLGTHDNCNGGVTPWGTVLSGEEGSAEFFGGDWRDAPDLERLKRGYFTNLGPHGRYGWNRVDKRFDVGHEPHESNRFEWVVEIDPLDPTAPPVKRTALGRFAHEGAHSVVAPDGRVVVYLGDDWEYEYCYRFVSRDVFNPHDRAANRDLLDHGTLSVARFAEDGTLDWAPLVFGIGPLTPANGFAGQGDVLLETRRAADLLGATPMDSPEGYEPNPMTGRVYIALTGVDARTRAPNPANPRRANPGGHILELVPPDRGQGPDHAADRFAWNVFALCGDPAAPGSRARFHPDAGPEDWFEAPDNLSFDAAGRMWICTDGPGVRQHDGVWMMHTSGPERAWPRLFYSPPPGSECCSPAFTRDGKAMFLSVQHPAERSPSLDQAATRWPDFTAGHPPRPSVIVIERENGGGLA